MKKEKTVLEHYKFYIRSKKFADMQDYADYIKKPLNETAKLLIDGQLRYLQLNNGASYSEKLEKGRENKP